jgi:hypothetical protein
MHVMSALSNVAVSRLGLFQGLESQCLSKQQAPFPQPAATPVNRPWESCILTMVADPFLTLVCLQEVTAADGHSVLWWGIDVVNPAHSAPSQLESQGRGDQRLWWVVVGSILGY